MTDSYWKVDQYHVFTGKHSFLSDLAMKSIHLIGFSPKCCDESKDAIALPYPTQLYPDSLTFFPLLSQFSLSFYGKSCSLPSNFDYILLSFDSLLRTKHYDSIVTILFLTFSCNRLRQICILAWCWSTISW